MTLTAKLTDQLCAPPHTLRLSAFTAGKNFY